MPGISDAELRRRLEAHNYSCPPITGSTKSTLIKKLSDEEDDDDQEDGKEDDDDEDSRKTSSEDDDDEDDDEDDDDEEEEEEVDTRNGRSSADRSGQCTCQPHSRPVDSASRS